MRYDLTQEDYDRAIQRAVTAAMDIFANEFGKGEVDEVHLRQSIEDATDDVRTEIAYDENRRADRDDRNRPDRLTKAQVM
jgi:stringent starvation protein B